MSTTLRPFLFFVLLAGSSLSGCTTLHAVHGSAGSIYLGSVQVSLRAGGRTLPTFTRHGQTYVLGHRGLNYAIFVQNRTNQRLEVVVSVDGRDVISGVKTRDYQRRGYVLNPHRYVNITGFRTSQSSVAAFRFSSVPNSYAARMGDRWTRIGSIQIAVFHERRPIAYIPRRPRHPYYKHSHNRGADLSTRSKRSTRSEASKHGGKAQPTRRHGRFHRRIYRPAPKLGTAYGRQVYAPAKYTTFVRASQWPTYRVLLTYNNCTGFHARRIYPRWCRRPIRIPRHKRPLIQPRKRYAPPPP